METQRGIFHVLLHSPNDSNGWFCVRLESGVWSLIWVSHVGAKPKELGVSVSVFPRQIIRELDQKRSRQNLNQC